MLRTLPRRYHGSAEGLQTWRRWENQTLSGSSFHLSVLHKRGFFGFLPACLRCQVHELLSNLLEHGTLGMSSLASSDSSQARRHSFLISCLVIVVQGSFVELKLHPLLSYTRFHCQCTRPGDAALVCEVYRRVNMASLLQAVSCPMLFKDIYTAARDFVLSLQPRRVEIEICCMVASCGKIFVCYMNHAMPALHRLKGLCEVGSHKEFE